MAFELKIYTDLSTLPKTVETNIDEIEPVIASAIAKVDGLVVTDNRDDIIAADADAAKLTKMADAVKRFRIDHIALWKTPMEAFEEKCKSAEKRLTEAATALRSKTNEVKDIWRNRKRDKCAELYAQKLLDAFADDEGIRECDGVRAFFDLWTNPRTKGTWLNSSVTMETVGEAIDAEIARVKQVIEGAKAVYGNESAEVQAKARYALLKSFNLTDAIQEVTEWKREQAAIAEAAEKAKAEREAADLRAAQDAQKHALEQSEDSPKNFTSPAPADASKGVSATENGKPVETYRLAVTGTRAALIEMKRYAQTLGITFVNLDR